MKFLLDECLGLTVYNYLTDLGHDVINAAVEYSGDEDSNILSKSLKEDRIIITNDKDFGELVFRDGLSHRGIILLRLLDERKENKVRCVKSIIEELGEALNGKFIVVTDKGIQIQHRIR